MSIYQQKRIRSTFICPYQTHSRSLTYLYWAILFFLKTVKNDVIYSSYIIQSNKSINSKSLNINYKTSFFRRYLQKSPKKSTSQAYCEKNSITSDLCNYGPGSRSKAPGKKPPDKSHRTKSPPVKKPPRTKAPQNSLPPNQFAPKTICPPNQFALPRRSFSHYRATGLRVY